MVQQSKDSSLASRLATVDDTAPRAIYRGVLDELLAEVPADMALFYQPTVDGGTYLISKLFAVGRDPSLLSWGQAFEGQEVPDTAWKTPGVDEPGYNRFVRGRTLYTAEDLQSYGVWRDIMLPMEIPDNLRALIYEGNRMVGWLGLMRRGMAERFTKKEERRLNAAMPQIRAVLLAAEDLESELITQGICAVMTPEGAIEHASDGFQHWYQSQVQSFLRDLVTTADSQGVVQTEMVYKGLIWRCLRLAGDQGTRYMISAEGGESLRITPASILTERQHEIARLVCIGATSREIADELDLSYHTVRTHVRNIYERLEIASKVDLIRLMDAS